MAQVAGGKRCSTLSIPRLLIQNRIHLHLKPDAFEESIRNVLFKTRRGRTYQMLFVIRGAAVHVVSIRGAGQQPIRPDEIELPE